MQELSPQQKKKLQRLSKVVDGGNIAILEHLFDIEEQIEDAKAEIEQKLPKLENIIEKVRGQKGDTGESIKGDIGDKGDKGDTGPVGKKGADSKVPGPKGDKGDKGDKGEPGRDGTDGKDGVDGFVDESTVAYLEDEIKRVEDRLKEVDTEAKRSVHMHSRRLDTLTDVYVPGVTNGQTLVYDSASQTWRAGSGGGGGGHTIQDEGTPLTARTNLNFVGGGVTVTDGGAGPDSTIVTISAGSGITRTIISTSGNTTMAAVASTDYVYIVTGAHTMTLPTAVGNTNLYTVRNNHSVPITVDTTSSQNIIGSVTATSYSVYNGDARSFISNGTAWNIV